MGAAGSVSSGVRPSTLEDVLSTALLLHAGIADSRMWHPQEAALRAAGFDVLAPDLRGFGQRPMGTEPFSYARDVEALLDGPAAVVGASLGGRVALELAVLRPDLVERLVLIAPGLPGWAFADATRAGWAAEEAAFERGDFEAAAEASLRQWIDGPRRAPEAVDRKLRSAVREMLLRSYELQSGEEHEEDVLEPPINERLGDVRCPTLVIVGDEDIADMQGIAAHVAGSIDGARLVTVAGASHLPSLERPGEVDALLMPFLLGA
jgi:3-oxoadipate enol-lactonase